MGDAAVPPLILLLSDADAVIRHQATHVLGKIGSPGTVAALIASLKDMDSTVQLKAASSLGQIGDIKAIPELILLLGNENLDLQTAVNTALEQFGTAAIEPLTQSLLNESWRVREQAADILGMIRCS
jgi:HEAT repeat protein